MSSIKKLISIILSVVLICGTMFVFPITSEAAKNKKSTGDSDFNWLINNGVLTVNGSGAMPSYATKSSRPWDNEKNDIIKVVIGEGITEISEFAFCDFYNLTSIEMPSTLSVINNEAFSDGRSLSALSIPDNVEVVEKWAFRNCDNTEEVSLGAKLRYIGVGAFDMDKVKSFNVSKDNKYFHTIDGVLFDNDNVLVQFPDGLGKNISDYTVPEGTKEIGAGAFYNNTDLKSVTVADSVKAIGDSAFCFSYIEHIYFGDNVLEIGNKAFEECKLKDIKLPKYLKAIGNSAFYKAFSSECRSVFVPENVVCIGEKAFNSTYVSIEVDQNNKYFASINGSLFNKDKTELLYFPCDSKTTSFTCPSTLQIIHDNAFDIYGGMDIPLTEIKFNDELRIIGKNNFEKTQLKGRLLIPDSVTEIGDFCFGSSNDLDEIIIGENVLKMRYCFLSCMGYEGRIKFKGNAPDMSGAVKPRSSDKWEIYTPENDNTWSKEVFTKNDIDTSKLILYKWNTIVIDPVDINDCYIILKNDSYVYDGVCKEPEVTVKYNDDELIKDFDYSVSYNKNLYAGEASLTVRGLRNYYGEAKKTFTINKADQKISLSLSRSEFYVGETAVVCTQGIGTISYKSSNTNVASVNSNGLITAKSAGTAVITSTAAGDENYNSVSDSVEIKVNKTSIGYDINNTSYSFANDENGFGYPKNYRIPKERYKMFYRTDEEIDYWYNVFGIWNGNCHGMTTTSLLFNTPASSLEISDFNSTASYIKDLKTDDKSSMYNISLKNLIEGMLISQMTDETGVEKERHWDDLDGCVRAVLKCQKGEGSPVVFNYGIRSFGGHSLLAYRVDKVSSDTYKMAVYDCNYPMDEQYVNLKTDSQGNFVYWDYVLAGVYDVSSDENYCYMTYLGYDAVKEVWDSRLTNKARNVNKFSINSDNFIIKDASDTTVGKMKDGVFTGNKNDVYEYMLTDVDVKKHIICLPTGLYTVKAESIDVDNKLEVSALNKEQSVTVKTEIDSVELIVDDENQKSFITVNGEKGEKYDVRINSSINSSKTDKEIIYYGKCYDKPVTVGFLNGETFTANYSRSFAYVNNEPEIINEKDSRKNIGDFEYKVELNEKSYDYTGKTINPKVKVTSYFSDKELVEGKDYTLIYSDNIKSGHAKVTVIGIGEYYGEKSVSFTINSVDINKCIASVVNDKIFKSCDVCESDVIVMYGNKSLKEGIDYDLKLSESSSEKTILNIISVKYGNFNGSIVLDEEHLSNKVNVDKIVLDKTFIKATVGETIALNAKISPENADDKSLNWSSSNPSVVTVNDSGIINCKTDGTATVTVTTANFKTATCDVVVEKQAISVPKVTGVQFTSADNSRLSICWDNINLQNVYYYVEYRTEYSSWMSLSKTTDNTASISGLSSSTRYYVRVRASADGIFGNYSDEINTYTTTTLQPTQPATETPSAPSKEYNTEVEFYVSSCTLYRKDKRVFLIWLYDKNGHTTFTSSNTSIATVKKISDTSVMVTTKKEGKVTITAKNNGVKDTLKITVKNPKLNKKSKTLKCGRSFKIKIIGKIGKATFKSSNKKVAKVTKNGRVKAKKKGKATITVKTNGIKLKCKIKVK